MFKLPHNWSHFSRASKVMLQILQARLQTYMNCEFPDVWAGFKNTRRTIDQVAIIHWIIEKAREFQKNIYLCFIDYNKAFDCVNHYKLWKILKEVGIPDHLACPLRNLYTGQEATVRTLHGKIDWFKIGNDKLSMTRLYTVTLLIWLICGITSCETPGCMSYKLEPGLLGEISITSDM